MKKLTFKKKLETRRKNVKILNISLKLRVSKAVIKLNLKAIISHYILKYDSNQI